MFQSNIYYLRYYRLNLMMEELKVYEKPDGSLKHVVDLRQKVLRVDSDLAQKLPPEYIKKFGPMPASKFPLAVFMFDQTMLLWFYTEKEQKEWT